MSGDIQNIDPKPAAANAGKHVVKLSRSYSIAGEQRDTLEFRQPTGREIRECGYPLKPDGKFDMDVITALTAALTGATEGDIDALSAPDYSRCVAVVLDFTGDDEAMSTS